MRRRRRGLTSFAASAALWVAAGCNPTQNILAPAGPAAAEIERLWWVLFWGTSIASALVIGLLLWGVRRGHRAASPDEEVPVRETTLILVGGAAFPAVILTYFLVETVRVGDRVQLPSVEPALTVEVIGHQFWWEVRYPEHGVLTANELHIPAGEPVRLSVTSADVIHSFWAPNLHGKIDMNPGHSNSFWIQADTAGVYRGQCAEFCGIQHALMSFLVVAEPRERFEAWLAEQALPAEPPDTPLEEAGSELFQALGCAFCHTVRGIHEPEEVGTPGPDLTHLASRRTLAALTLPNTPENLGAWILDPHGFKRGVRMPATPLEPASLAALLAFMGSLR